MEILNLAVKDLGHTLVMITHNDDIAKKADNIITINDGKILY